MSEARVASVRSAFVPHDLTAPIIGKPSGPLAGLQAAIKDMYDIAGSRTGGGNPDWLRAQAPANVTAAAVQRLLDAGATIVGKTVCDEFLFSTTERRSIPAHPGDCPAAHRVDRHRPRRRAPAISRWAATPAGQCGCRPHFAAFLASVLRMVV